MKISQVLGIILVAVLISGGYLFNLYGDWLWFNSIGYPEVFLTVVFGSVTLGVLTGLGFCSPWGSVQPSPTGRSGLSSLIPPSSG
jgi:uncharacterized membrane protein (UPF0182 family)